jgi:hypothetical protein
MGNPLIDKTESKQHRSIKILPPGVTNPHNSEHPDHWTVVIGCKTLGYPKLADVKKDLLDYLNDPATTEARILEELKRDRLYEIK